MSVLKNNIEHLREMWTYHQWGTALAHDPYKIFTNTVGDTMALYLNKNRIIMAWDGSSNKAEWIDNFKAFPPCDGCHAGFEGAVREMLPDIVECLNDIFNIGKQNGVYYTIEQSGHSRGGAMASISEMKLRKAGFGAISTYTFGSPRPFTKKGFLKAKEMFMNVCNVRIDRDPVDNLPPRFFFCTWHHAPGTEVMLPTVKGTFDHLAFGEALDAKIKELADGK